MSAHGQRSVHMPENLQNVTHVLIKRAKPGPLGHQYEGPFEIVRRLGNTRLELRVGSEANGDPRLEIWNWENCKPAVLDTRLPPPAASRKPRGRKPKIPGTTKPPDEFIPTTNHDVLDNDTDDLSDDSTSDAPPLITRFGRRSRKPTRFAEL